MLGMVDKSGIDTTLETDDIVITPPANVIAYNEQRSCADLYRLAGEGQLTLDPDFQRGEVWSNAVKSRFIDSLAKQLPIPSMCLSIDASTSERIMIDGLQRTITIVRFLDESNEWVMSSIDDIDDRLKGRSNLYIRDKLPEVWSIIKNMMIPITVIRCDYSDKDNLEYLYMIFHRLNTNSVRLTNQEIRNGIFNGKLNTSLKEAAKDKAIIAVLGVSSRLSTEEYILRLIAFNNELETYNGRMAKYLNDFMFRQRQSDLSSQIDLIIKSADLINKRFSKFTGYEKLSKTAIEGLIYGVMQNLSTLENKDNQDLLSMFASFKSLQEFGPEALSEGVTSKSKVISRLRASANTFKD
jgi:hypothetical protein